MTAPRVRTVMKTSYSGSYKYKGHFIDIDRDDDKCGWWYIIVTAPNGMKDYDGWWRDSSGKSHREAVLEALRGAMLWPNEKAKGGVMENYQVAPIGTFAPCFSGGGWTKVENGWKWGKSGGTFPRPGADWDGRLLPTSENEKAKGGV